MKARIESVLLFLSDLTGQGLFNKRSGAAAHVTPPRRWLEETDHALGFGGELLNWIEERGISQRFEQFANGDQFRAFVKNEFPSRELKYRNCRTDAIGYNLVVVITTETQGGKKSDARPATPLHRDGRKKWWQFWK